ncbi:MAG: DMT family transporter [Rhodospirillaceae bacterium]|jgi:drug/metabolite transporter (DMT)-like permease|nr:DMT family transporter [Rhodospirillaceae bacterium]
MASLSPHQRGLLLTVVGVLVLTPDALMVRLVEVDYWTALFWRSLFAALVLFALNAVIEKENPIEAVFGLFRNGMLCALFFAGSNVCFVISITHTTVANTLVILASMPFIAAVLTIVLMRKNLALRTWMTIVLAMVGIVMVFWGRFGDGNTFGDIIAVFCALFMAATLVLISANPRINSTAAIGLGAFLAALFAFFMGAEPTAVTNRDLIVLVANGGVIIPVAMGLITYGPKLISAPEVSLIMLLETVLGPLWVWLALSERPLPQTFVGGSLVIAAVLVNAWLGFRTMRPNGRTRIRS